MGEQEVRGAGQRDGVVNARRRGCGSGSLRLSSPGGFRSQLCPRYISPVASRSRGPNGSPATSLDLGTSLGFKTEVFRLGAEV